MTEILGYKNCVFAAMHSPLHCLTRTANNSTALRLLSEGLLLTGFLQGIELSCAAVHMRTSNYTLGVYGGSCDKNDVRYGSYDIRDLIGKLCPRRLAELDSSRSLPSR